MGADDCITLSQKRSSAEIERYVAPIMLDLYEKTGLIEQLLHHEYEHVPGRSIAELDAYRHVINILRGIIGRIRAKVSELGRAFEKCEDAEEYTEELYSLCITTKDEVEDALLDLKRSFLQARLNAQCLMGLRSRLNDIIDSPCRRSGGISC